MRLQSGEVNVFLSPRCRVPLEVAWYGSSCRRQKIAVARTDRRFGATLMHMERHVEKDSAGKV